MSTSVLKLSLPMVLIFSFWIFNPVQSEKGPFECIVCVEGVHEGCNDPFDEKNENYKVSCDTAQQRPAYYEDEHREEFNYKNKKAVGCRKIQQEIDDKTHTVRQCAFSGEDVNGLKRTGNKGVRVYYYQCSNENYCNNAIRLNSISILFLVTLAFSSILILFNH